MDKEKKRSYQVAFFALWDLLISCTRIPAILSILFIGIEHSQILSCFINDLHFPDATEHTMPKYILKYFSIFRTHATLEYLGYSLYFTIHWLLVAFLLAVWITLLFIFRYLMTHKKGYSFLLNLLSFFCELISGVLFMPLLFFLIVPFDCTYLNGTLLNHHFPEKECYQGESIGTAVTSFITIIILMCLTACTQIFLSDTRGNGKTPLGKNSIVQNLVLLTLKIILIFSSLPLSDSQNYFFLLLSISIYCILFWLHIRRRVYIKKAMDIYAFLLIAGSLDLLIGLLIALAFNDPEILTASIISLPILCFFVSFFKGNPLLLSKLNKHTILDQLRDFLYAINNYHHRYFRTLLLGNLAQHSNSCTDINCELYYQNSKKIFFSLQDFEDEDKKSQLISTLKEFSQRVFQEFLIQNGNNVALSLEYCVFCIDEGFSPIKALAELKHVEELPTNFYEKFLLYHYEREIEKISIKTSGGYQRAVSNQLSNIAQQNSSMFLEIYQIQQKYYFNQLIAILNIFKKRYDKLVQQFNSFWFRNNTVHYLNQDSGSVLLQVGYNSIYRSNSPLLNTIFIQFFYINKYQRLFFHKISNKKKYFYDHIKREILSLVQHLNIKKGCSYFKIIYNTYKKLFYSFIQSIFSNYSQIIFIAQQIRIRDFEELLRHITNKFIELWCSLEDEAPNYTLMEQTLLNLCNLVESAEEEFQIIINHKLSNAKVLFLFGTFLKFVMKNELKSEKYLKRASERSRGVGGHEILLGDLSSSEMKHITSDTPILIVSGTEKNMGGILDSNSSFLRLFGYSKRDLVGNHINMLIPYPYRKYHDSIIRSRNGNFTEKSEVNAFGLHRNQYIFPATIRIVRAASSLNSKTFVIAIKENDLKLNFTRAHVITDTEFNILHISSQSMNILKLSQTNFTNLKINKPFGKSKISNFNIENKQPFVYLVLSFAITF